MVVLAISDLQEPFGNPHTHKFLKALKRRYRPDKVVVVGDEADFKFLKYAAKHDDMTPMQQHKLAIERLKPVYDLFPDATVLNSNHVSDRLKYACEVGGLPLEFLKPTRDLLEAPDGWQWTDSIEIDGVRYEHGHLLTGGKRVCDNAVNLRHQSVVFGHHPLLQVNYQSINGRMYFGMCVGALTVPSNGYRTSWGMSYAKKYGREMPQGSGIIIDGEYALPIPLVV